MLLVHNTENKTSFVKQLNYVMIEESRIIYLKKNVLMSIYLFIFLTNTCDSEQKEFVKCYLKALIM